MEFYLLTDCDEPCYLVIGFDEGYTAYDANDTGKEMIPIVQSRYLEDIKQDLEALDSDSSVGLSVHFDLVKLVKEGVKE